ncbi:MAG: hypothetical protein NUV46_02965 [Nanoarchaeota archaeon]|nr:hypothetical protein [Nanoarchaeota archaeon]
MVFIVKSIFLFTISLIFALWEIEIEGKNGWAKKLPTWYRKSGLSKVFYFFSSKKPLSGYHLFMMSFMILIFHLLFFFGESWTLIKEFEIVLAIFIFLFLEDFLWFKFNPYFGLKKFKRNNIWWHDGKGKWIFGKIPAVYLKSLGTLIFLIIIFSGITKSYEFLYDNLLILLTLTIFTVLSSLLVRPYKNWYKKMREIDESKNFGRKLSKKR